MKPAAREQSGQERCGPGIGRPSGARTSCVGMRASGGFTLVELLIVIAIIMLLASISLPVIGALITNARSAATTVTIRKVDDLLQARIKNYKRYIDEQTRDRRVGAEFKKQGPKTKGLLFTADPYLPGAAPKRYISAVGPVTDPKQTLKAIVLAQKGQFRRFFPQSWAEFEQYGWNTELGVSKPSPVDPATESAEVLFVMLTKMSIPGVGDDGNDMFTPVELADTNQNGKTEIVDAWSRPLRFYRWPTSLFRMAARDSGIRQDAAAGALAMCSGSATQWKTLAGAIDKDLDDPRRLYPKNGTNGAVGSPTAFGNAFHQISTFSLPMVVSAGVDGELGLKEPGDLTSDPVFRRLGRLAFTVGDAEATGLSPDDEKRCQEQLGFLLDNVTNLNITAGRAR
jgi:prepilin-type N-terminal cleavage/methylation domain-containing protein